MARHVVLSLVLAAAAPASVASADVLKIYGEAHGGGMYGTGATTGQAGFFEQSKGGAYGLLAGARLLFIDFHVLHHQYPSDGVSTWTQFNAGLDFQVDTGGAEAKKNHNGGYVEVGAWIGFGLATGAQVDPPLDNAQVSDKGFIAEGRFGFGKHLNKVLDIGVELPVSWGYIFRNGDGAAANDIDSQYQSIQVEGLLVVRGNIKLL